MRAEIYAPMLPETTSDATTTDTSCKTGAPIQDDSKDRDTWPVVTGRMMSAGEQTLWLIGIYCCLNAQNLLILFTSYFRHSFIQPATRSETPPRWRNHHRRRRSSSQSEIAGL